MTEAEKPQPLYLSPAPDQLVNALLPVHDLAVQLADALAEVDRLRADIAETDVALAQAVALIQRGEEAAARDGRCSYCGFVGLKTEFPEHIRTCVSHPLAEALAQRDGARAAKDLAYSERNQLLSLLARMALALGWKAGTAQHPAEDTTWEEDWRTLLFVDLPTGQASWHFHDSERHLLAGLPEYGGKWDGHGTDAKYERVRTTLTVDPCPHGPRDPWTLCDACWGNVVVAL